MGLYNESVWVISEYFMEELVKFKVLFIFSEMFFKLGL